MSTTGGEKEEEEGTHGELRTGSPAVEVIEEKVAATAARRQRMTAEKIICRRGRVATPPPLKERRQDLLKPFQGGCVYYV
jgi:hypothetical protein